MTLCFKLFNALNNQASSSWLNIFGKSIVFFGQLYALEGLFSSKNFF